MAALSNSTAMAPSGWVPLNHATPPQDRVRFLLGSGWLSRA